MAECMILPRILDPRGVIQDSGPVVSDLLRGNLSTESPGIVWWQVLGGFKCTGTVTTATPLDCLKL